MKLLAGLTIGIVLTLAWQAKAATELSSPNERPAAGDTYLEAKVARQHRTILRLRKKLGHRERQLYGLHRAMRSRVELAGGVASAFMCIHFGEGSLTDDGAPYWGGLQMDGSFMSTYGGNFLRKLGTADHWPPFVQVAVAMNAYYSGRGFHPWPNTARSCGLL